MLRQRGCVLSCVEVVWLRASVQKWCAREGEWACGGSVPPLDAPRLRAWPWYDQASHHEMMGRCFKNFGEIITETSILHAMDVSVIVKAIDDRIAALQQAKTLLSATAVPATEKRAKEAAAAIQPKNVKGTSAAAPAKSANGRKPMSEEGRARIAAAQKKRWALRHAGTATTGNAAKKAGSKASAAKTSATTKKSAAAKSTVPAKKVAIKKSAVKKAAAKQVEPSTEAGTPETEQAPS